MANFESQIGGRKVSGRQLQEFDVPDGEDDNPNFNVDEVINSNNFQKLDEDGIRQFQQKLNSINIEEENDYRAPQQPRRSSPQPQFEDDVKEVEIAHQYRRKGIERLSQGAKKRIEMLIGMTRSSKSINIDGTEYILQTLKSQETRDALLAAAKFEHTVEFPFEFRLQYLARSLVKIAGIDIDQFLSDSSFSSKIAFINELDEHLLKRLYDEYINLSKEASNKYSVNTAKEAEGVIDDLKK